MHRQQCFIRIATRVTLNLMTFTPVPFFSRAADVDWIGLRIRARRNDLRVRQPSNHLPLSVADSAHGFR